MFFSEELKKNLYNDFYSHDDHDAFEIEDFEYDYDFVMSIPQYCMEISIKLLELFEDKIENVLIEMILPYFVNMTRLDKPTDREILLSLCIFGTFCEKCSQQKFNEVQ